MQNGGELERLVRPTHVDTSVFSRKDMEGLYRPNGAMVLTFADIIGRVAAPARELLRTASRHEGVVDGIGIIARPSERTAVVVAALHPNSIQLSRYERRLLTQAALHVESGYRVRARPEVIKGERSSQGRVVDRDDDAPSADLLEHHGRRVALARSSRRGSSSESLELWTALVGGAVSLAPRVRGGRRHYLVLENSIETKRMLALSPGERSVLTFAARGLPNKLVAYALGLSPTTVSLRLASAASKLGTASRIELLRIASQNALPPRDDDGPRRSPPLTASEQDVLDLVRSGLSNQDIADARSRSVRTVANQVASLLQKMRVPSRRGLI